MSMYVNNPWWVKHDHVVQCIDLLTIEPNVEFIIIPQCSDFNQLTIKENQYNLAIPSIA